MSFLSTGSENLQFSPLNRLKRISSCSAIVLEFADSQHRGNWIAIRGSFDIGPIKDTSAMEFNIMSIFMILGKCLVSRNWSLSRVAPFGKIGELNFGISLSVIEAKFIVVVLLVAVISGDYQTRNSYP
jgi:hypothetical protein